MKHCASCGRDIAESATVCEPCEQWASEHVAQPAAPAQAALRSEETARVAAPAVAPRRRPVALFVALGAIAIGALAFMSNRGVPAARVAAAQPAAMVPTRGPAAVVRPAAVRTQAWSTERRAYWTGSQRHSAAFELAAENSVPIWLSQVRPLLIVRCMSKKTEAFVFTGSALKIEPQTDDHTVNFRFDDETGTTVRWPDSAEHDALFSPDAVAFTQRVMQARTLRFGYTPHNAAPVEAVFRVEGLSALIEPVGKDCGWKK